MLRLINFAHSEVFMIGTFAAMWTWGCSGFDQNTAVTGVGTRPVPDRRRSGRRGRWRRRPTAVAVERVAYRPLRKRNAPPLAFLITAIGASLVLSEAGRHLSPSRRPFGMPQR